MASTAIERSPEYWLTLLLRAVRTSDFELAAQAQKELERLGIDIKVRAFTDQAEAANASR